MNDLFGTIDYDGDSLINIRKLGTLSSYSSNEWAASYSILSANSAEWQSTFNTVYELSGAWSKAASGSAPLSAAGNIYDVQYNNGGGAFGGTDAFTYNPNTSSLLVQNIIFNALTGLSLSFFETATSTNAFITFQVGTSSFGIPVVRV